MVHVESSQDIVEVELAPEFALKKIIFSYKGMLCIYLHPTVFHITSSSHNQYNGKMSMCMVNSRKLKVMMTKIGERKSTIPVSILHHRIFQTYQ